jgi:coronin-1B/1C/6
MLPKRAMNVSACEIARLLKAETNRVEPISFIVPRKSELYQDDLYPDAISTVPAMTADEWKEGKNADPDRSYSMAPGFVAAVHPADFHPVLKEEPKAEKPKTEKELKDEIEELKKRVAYLETELEKRDNQIKQLQQQ